VLLAQRREGLFIRRRETLVIDGVVNHVDFVCRQAEIRNDLLLYHLGIANDAAQMVMLIHLTFSIHDIAVIAVSE